MSNNVDAMKDEKVKGVVMSNIYKLCMVFLVVFCVFIIIKINMNSKLSYSSTRFYKYNAYVQIIHGNNMDDATKDNLVKIPTDDVNICRSKRHNPNIGSCHIVPVYFSDYSKRNNPEITGDHGEF